MSAYIQSPFKPNPNAITPGMPSYLWGSFLDKTGPTVGKILSTSGNGTTSTIVVQILGGNIPIVSSLSVPLITIVGTANGSGNYNVTNVALASISAAANPDQGIYTLTFLGSGSSAVASDSGQFVIPQPEVAETLVSGASIPVAQPFNIMGPNLDQGITASVTLVSTTSAAAVISLQQAVVDRDSEYSNVATIATITAGTTAGTVFEVTIDPTLGRFFRFNNTGVSGSGSIVAKLIL